MKLLTIFSNLYFIKATRADSCNPSSSTDKENC